MFMYLIKITQSVDVLCTTLSALCPKLSDILIK